MCETSRSAPVASRNDGSRADIDPETTRSTRRSLMEQLERDGSTVAAVHMPAPGFGKIARLEGRRYWQAL